MEFIGRVIQFLGETTGTSKTGNPWKKKEWVVETNSNSQYPRKVKIQCFGEKSDSINLETGKDYTLFVDLESREFNERWYTDVNVYRVSEIAPQQQFGQPNNFGGYQQSSMGPQQPYGSEVSPFSPEPAESEEDLPF